MCVVLVDDEPYIRLLAGELLRDAGHRVVEFETATDAIAYCADPEHEVLAVLTDINMPGEEDGLDLAAYVVKARPEVAVIVTSGRYAALPSGLPPGIRFLPKPWTIAALLQTIPPVP